MTWKCTTVGRPSLFGGRILSYVFGSAGRISENDNDVLNNYYFFCSKRHKLNLVWVIPKFVFYEHWFHLNDIKTYSSDDSQTDNTNNCAKMPNIWNNILVCWRYNCKSIRKKNQKWMHCVFQTLKLCISISTEWITTGTGGALIGV